MKLHWEKGNQLFINSPGRRPWELTPWCSIRRLSGVRPTSNFSFKQLLLKDH